MTVKKDRNKIISVNKHTSQITSLHQQYYWLMDLCGLVIWDYALMTENVLFPLSFLHLLLISFWNVFLLLYVL